MRGALRIHSLLELIALAGWSLANVARGELAASRVAWRRRHLGRRHA